MPTFQSHTNDVMDTALRIIPTRVRHDGLHYFVDDEIIDCYGIGETLAEAQADYLLAVQDLYDDLSANEERLAPYLLTSLNFLRRTTRHVSCLY
jgi:hypothetical protein